MKRGRRIWATSVAVLIACGFASLPARAAITGTCTAGATGVGFGTYNLLSATPLTSTGTVTVDCSGATKITGTNTVTVSLSTGQSGTYNPRSLGAGFTYNLYLNSADTEIWGDGSGTTLTYSGTITKKAPSFTATVYGEIPALQNPAPGSYSDTITVTVSY